MQERGDLVPATIKDAIPGLDTLRPPASLGRRSLPVHDGMGLTKALDKMEANYGFATLTIAAASGDLP